MKYPFCPNISLPENKKRIKEVGLDNFYQEYYEQNFSKPTYNDLAPNFSILYKLFVDIDKFTDSQQNEIVDSIIYELEQGKKEGFSNVSDLFDYAQDVFRNQRDDLKSFNSDAAWDQYIQMFDNIDNYWDKFREKVEDKLKGVGV